MILTFIFHTLEQLFKQLAGSQLAG